ncbi:MAG: PilN domain-containing protein [Candidatus Blackburnbacteria bacterium]|nr:PilN domain-containing protein [Candidatus Blackburnbacteria bacterium]
MSAPKRREINLLTKRGFENALLGKVTNWALSAGRVIVIVTELIVIAAFLSRFWLDRTLTDLNEQNAALKTQVEAFSSFEKDFRNAQERLSLYDKLSSSQTYYSKFVKELASLLPADVALTNISASDNSVEIKGRSLSENGIAGLISALEKSKTIKDVKLSDLSLDTKGQQLIVFSLKGGL